MCPLPSSVHGTGGMGKGDNSKFLPKTRSHRTTPSLAQLPFLCTQSAPDAPLPRMLPQGRGLLTPTLSIWEVWVAPVAG